MDGHFMGGILGWEVCNNTCNAMCSVVLVERISS